MNLKQIVQLYFPSIVVDWLRWLLKRPAELEYISEGWGYKTKDSNIKGWNVESYVNAQKDRFSLFVKSVQGTNPMGISHEANIPSNDEDYVEHNTMMAYAYVLALAARKKDSISLLDWGGGVGQYYTVSKALLPDVEIDYHCKEVPLICECGRELLPNAHFYDNEEDCFKRSYDVVLASASLYIHEDWKKVVQRLASATSSYLYITRLPIVLKSKSFVMVHRLYPFGYQTEYLGWIINRDEFLNHLSELQMELIREFLIQEKRFVHRAPEQVEYRGFLFRPRQGLIYRRESQ